MPWSNPYLLIVSGLAKTDENQIQNFILGLDAIWTPTFTRYLWLKWGHWMGKNVDNDVLEDLNEVGNIDPLHSDESSLPVQVLSTHTP